MYNPEFEIEIDLDGLGFFPFDDESKGILNDRQIRETFAFDPRLTKADNPDHGIIHPFNELVKTGISYGLSSFGYDIRLSPNDFYVFHLPSCWELFKKALSMGSKWASLRHPISTWKLYKSLCWEAYQSIDPKNFDVSKLRKVELETDGKGKYFTLPANSYGLGVALEFIKLPSDVSVICVGKSTLARAALMANITPIEAGWQGHLTVELANLAPHPLKVYAGEGIAQIVFFRGDRCENPYKGRKYDNQPEKVVFPRVV